jgi:hypothetical protein
LPGERQEDFNSKQQKLGRGDFYPRLARFAEAVFGAISSSVLSTREANPAMFNEAVLNGRMSNKSKRNFGEKI